MGLLLQMTDTHILPAGELLYDTVDSALHLRQSVESINRMQLRPDVVVITGDLVDHGDLAGYEHFIRLISPLEMPVYVIPGNHDDPQVMREAFAKTDWFPVADETFQYAVEDLPFRILAMNSNADGTELPELCSKRLAWLEKQLEVSDRPTVIAMHHPPMKTGIELIEIGRAHV